MKQVSVIRFLLRIKYKLTLHMLSFCMGQFIQEHAYSLRIVKNERKWALNDDCFEQLQRNMICLCVCLRRYVPVNIFSVILGRLSGLTSTKQWG